MAISAYTAEQRRPVAAPVPAPQRTGRLIVKMMTTTDHKLIGYHYLISAFGFFCIAGVMALLIRAELWDPGDAGTGRVRSAAEAASRGLATVAGAIERSKPVQAGERSQTRPGRWTVHRWLTRNSAPTSGQSG
jgi:hypothetical protein